MREPNFLSYIVRTDSGFAPNPLGGVCTLACCKPRLRSSANIGDWVIGTTPAPRAGRLTYAMRVTRGLTFDLYFDDPAYDSKKPSPNNPRGDNIYRATGSGLLEQVPNSAHDARHFRGDISVNRVLISDEFWYFGKAAPPLPERFLPLVHSTQGHKKLRPINPGYEIGAELVNWLGSEYEPGLLDEPAEEEIYCRPPEEDDTDE